MVDRNLLLTVARVLRRQLDDDSDPMSLAYVVARNADKAALDAALDEMSGPIRAEEPYIERIRRLIEEQYLSHPTGCGSSFGEILCYEIHEGGMTFIWLAEKWGINLSTLGELIYDHCKRLQEDPVIQPT